MNTQTENAKFLIACNRSAGFYVRFINPTTGSCGWTSDRQEAMRFTKQNAEIYSEGIGRAVAA